MKDIFKNEVDNGGHGSNDSVSELSKLEEE